MYPINNIYYIYIIIHTVQVYVYSFLNLIFIQNYSNSDIYFNLTNNKTVYMYIHFLNNKLYLHL